MVFTVTRNGAVGAAATATWTVSTSGKTAENADFTLLSGTVTVAVGATTQSISVPLSDDAIYEGDETFTITLSNESGAALADAAADGTITDAGDLPELTIANGSGTEGGTATFTVTRTGASELEATASWAASTVADTAEAADLTGTLSGTVTIAASSLASATTTITVQLADDNLHEGEESFTVALSGAVNAALGVSEASGAIIDDDALPDIVLSVDPDSVAEDAGETAVTVTAELVGGAVFPMRQTLTVTVGGPGDSAVEGSDYASVADLQLTIAAGALSGTATFAITPVDDTELSATRRVTVDGTVTVGEIGATVSGTSLTIIEDDLSRSVFLTVTGSKDLERISEGGGTQTLTVTATVGGDGTFNEDTVVTLAVGAEGDTAQEGVDYAAVAEVELTIDAGQKQGTAGIDLTPLDDDVDEGDEAITVRGTIGADEVLSGTIVIEDDDDPPTGIALSVNPATHGEAGGPVAVAVTATVEGGTTYATAQTVTVSVAGSGAATAVDFEPISEFTIEIPAGAGTHSGQFTLTPEDDDRDETDETLTVSGRSGVLTITPATLNLTDDDAAPTGVALSVNPGSAGEAAGATPVTVTATVQGGTTYATAREVTVAVGASGDAATEGTDYATVADVALTIAAGAATDTATFTIDPTQDVVDEGSGEAVSVAGTLSGVPVSGTTFTITDDDDPPTGIALTVNPTTHGEDGGPVAVAVTATVEGGTTYAAVQTVTVSVAGSGAAEAVDFEPVTEFTIEIPAGAGTHSGQFTLTPEDDDRDETDETLTVSGSSGTLTIIPATLSLIDDEAAPAVTLVLTPPTVNEDGGESTVTATLDRASAAATTVTVSATGAAATVSASSTLSMAAGQTSSSGQVTLSGVDDEVSTGNRTVTVRGAADNDIGVVDPSPVTLTVTDDDAAPELAIADATGAEDDGAVEFTVTRSGATGAAATADWTVSTSGKTAEDADFTTLSGTVTVAAGATTQTISVPLADDAIYEGDETFTITLSNESGAALADAAADGTITDTGDLPELTIANGSGMEGGSATFAVTRSGASELEATASWAASTNSDTAEPADLTGATSGTVTIAASNLASATTTITFHLADDNLHEGEETFTVTLSSPTMASLGTPSEATGTINDDDAAPSGIGLSVNPAGAGEAAGTTLVTVTATVQGGTTWATARTVTVAVGATGDAATEGTDYAPVADVSLSIAAGAATGAATFTIDPTQDVVDEGSGEAVSVAGTLSGVTVTGADFTITDDDAAPTGIALSVSPTTHGEDGGPAAVMVTATVEGGTTYASAQTVTVSAAGSGAATAVDFEPVSEFAIEIPAGAGSHSGQFTLTPEDDEEDETDETLTVSGSSGTLTITSASLSLTDDEDAPAVTLVLTPDEIGEDGGVSTVTATLDRASAAATTVTVSATGAAATVSASSTLSMAAGQTSSSGQVTLSGVDDEVSTGNRTVTVRGAADNDIGVVDPPPVTLTVTDDDLAPTLAIADATGAEDGGAVEFTVTRSGAVGAEATADWTVSTSGKTAEAADFTTLSGTVTVAVGDTTQTISVPLAADDVYEGDETFGITLSAATGATLATPAAEGTITDAGDLPTLTIADGNGTEGGTATFTVTRTGASELEAGVSWAASTASDTAEPADLTGTLSGTVTITASPSPSDTTTVTVHLADDNLHEGEETFTVTLSSPTKASLGTPSTAAGTVNDDDAAPSGIALSVDPTTHAEDGGPTAVRVTATVEGGTTYASAQTVTVAVAGSGTATAVDFTPVSEFTIEIPAAATAHTGQFTLTPEDDDRDETDETLTVSGSSGTLTIIPATLSLIDDEAAPAVTLVLTPPTVNEDGGESTVTATLDRASAAATTVTVSATGAAATVSASSTLSMAAGQTSSSGQVTLSGVDDEVSTGNRTVTVRGAADNDIGVVDPPPVTLTVTDDEAAPALAIGDATGAEADGAVVFTVTRTGAVGAEATATWTVSTSGKTAEDADFTTLSGSVTVAVGATTQTISVPVADDAIYEGDESFGITVSAATGATLATPDAEGTITDAGDLPVLTIAEGSGAEGGTATFTVTRTGASELDATASWAASTDSGTAEAADLTGTLSGTVTVAASSSASDTATITVDLADDDRHEGEETFTVTLSAPTAASLGTPSTTGTITDTDTAPALSIADASGAEADGVVVFTVTRNGAAGAPATATWTVSTDTGTAEDADFTALTGTVTLVQDATTQTIPVPLAADDVYEDEETFTITLSHAIGAVLADATAEGTITAEEITKQGGLPTLTIADASGAEGGTVTFTVTRTGATELDATVNWAASTASPATASAADLTGATSGTVTVTASPATSATTTITVHLADDDLHEGAETFTVTLSAPAEAKLGTPSSATGTITDDEEAPTVTLALTPATIDESGATNASTVTASLNHASSAATTVTVNAVAVAPAVEGDFTLSANRTLTIAAGETASAGTVTITANDNNLDAPNKQVTVSATATNSQGVTAPSARTLTIADDEGAPTLSIADARGVEGGGAVTFTVTLAGAVATPVVAEYATASGTGANPATAGDDYASAAGTLTFNPGGPPSRTIRVSVSDDEVDEEDETFEVTLSGPQNVQLARATATGTIVDDDERGVTVSPEALRVPEGGSRTYTIVLDTRPTDEVTVTVSVPGGTDVTVDRSALRFTAADWDTPQTVTVSAAEDEDTEPDAAVSIGHAAAGADYDGESAQVTVTIAENDEVITILPAVVTLAVAPASVAEGAGSVTVTVSADLVGEPRTAATEVTVAVGGGSATEGADYEAVPEFTVTIGAGAASGDGTFTLTPVDDGEHEGDETVTVAGAIGVRTVSAATIVIEDDDAAPPPPPPPPSPPQVSIADASAREDAGSMAFAVRLDAAPQQAVRVTWATADGTATAGADYTRAGGELTFAAGQTERTIRVAVLDDVVDEADETFQVRLSDAVNATLGDAEATGTIVDDDAAPTGIVLTVTPTTHSEDGGPVAVTVTATVEGGTTYATAQPVIVSVAGSGAADAVDFEPVTEFTITIPAGTGSHSGQFTLTPEDDDRDESDETLTVSGSSGTLRITPASLSLTDDDAAPTLTIAGARALESAGEMAFVVTLDAPSGREVSVVCVSADLTATADEDYEPERGVLSFAPGETEQEIRMTVLDDARPEPDETFRMDLSEPAHVRLAAEVVSAIGTIVDDDVSVWTPWLARFGRTVTEQVLDAVGERMLGGAAPGSQVTVAGQRLQPGQPARAWEGPAAPAAGGRRTMSGRELLAGSAVRWVSAHRPEEREAGAGEADGSLRLTVWGRGAATHFDGSDGALTMAGDVLTGTFGVDGSHGGVLAGLAVSRSGGDGDYRDGGRGDGGRPAREGELRAILTGVHPYVRVAPDERLTLWGVFGYGLGTLRQSAAGNEAEADIRLLLGALGTRAAVLTAEQTGGFGLAVKADGYLLRMTSEPTAMLAAAQADVSRLRLVATGSGAMELGARRVLTPSLEVGVRHDGGDAETGAGVELGGGLKFADAASGLTLAADGRVLLAHQDRGYREWGAGGSLRFDPGAPGRGVALGVDSSYGATAGGAERLWSLPDADGLATAPAAAAGARLAAELAYGLQAPGGGSAKPYAGVELTDGGTRAWRVGTRFSLGAFTAGVEGTRRETSRTAAPVHGFTVNASLRW